MEMTTNIVGKVVLYKGRVWTVYGYHAQGAYAFNGLKPYPEWKFDSNNNYHNYRITYIPAEDIKVVLETEGAITAARKGEEASEKKKLTKTYAAEFFSFLTGHPKAFVSRNLVERHNGWHFEPGWIQYEIWKMDNALYLSHNTENGYSSHAYFDFVTWEPEDRLYERNKRAMEEEIAEKYR
jgi:hypothetical protein